MLYFSYGSNMSSARLLARVPSARLITTATLIEHELRFHKRSVDGSGKCDAFQTGDSNHQVIGAVFEIDAREKPDLDRHEGVGYGYEEKEVTLIHSSGREIMAYSYYATHIDEGLKPYHWYKHHVLTGARENRLPTSYINRFLNVESTEDHNQERHELEMAIHATA